MSASLVHVNVTIEHDEFGTFELAGLDEDSCELTRRRVAPAIYNTLKRNDLEIAVEVTPTGTNNHGGQLDLAVAVAVLLAFEQSSLRSTVVLGELSRSGEVRHVRGILPALKAASTSHAIRHAIVPRADTAEAAHAGLDVRVVDHLRDVLDSLRGTRALDPAGPRRSTRSYERDLAEKPFMMASVRRALEIAAVGQHPLLIIGGAGRTSAALKLPGLLPSMTTDEAIELTSIYSIAGLLEAKQGLNASRPIRSPNYRDATLEKLLGRGDPACPGGVRPGEISLAHGGVLFLDELLEFRRSQLAALAVALAKGESSGFPARPLLVGAA
ncbi:ATP-binding protein, partial [Polyangium sp. 15x6]|uniref:ATP-binding protein n=1 Tax=Polyangium sp. 15x6 TaxID=3042687 RepID=UPI00249C9256